MKSLDLGTMGVMGIGIGLMLQPWWDRGLQVGFFLTIVGTLAQIVVSHLPARSAREEPGTSHRGTASP